jgi:hypothetical protein
MRIQFGAACKPKANHKFPPVARIVLLKPRGGPSGPDGMVAGTGKAANLVAFVGGPQQQKISATSHGCLSRYK